MKRTFKTNAKCAGCVAKIGEKLNHTSGITEWSIDLTNPNKTLLINSSLTDDEIITLEESEKRLISKALRIYGSDTTGKNICAEKLGIGIATLYRKIEKYKL